MARTKKVAADAMIDDTSPAKVQGDRKALVACEGEIAKVQGDRKALVACEGEISQMKQDPLAVEINEPHPIPQPEKNRTETIPFDAADIAERQEVLACLTSVMRGQDISRGQARAAEVLARILGLFAEVPGDSDDIARIIDDIPNEHSDAKCDDEAPG